jgi:hypothetical protein
MSGVSSYLTRTPVSAVVGSAQRTQPTAIQPCSCIGHLPFSRSGLGWAWVLGGSGFAVDSSDHYLYIE